MKLIKIGLNSTPKLNNDLDDATKLLEADSVLDSDINAGDINNPVKAVNPAPLNNVRIEEETIDTPKRFYIGAPVESVSVSYLDPNHKTIKAERKAAEKEVKRLAKMAEKENKPPAKRGRPRAALDAARFNKLMKNHDALDKSVFIDDTLIYLYDLVDKKTGLVVAQSYWDETSQEVMYRWI